jgi:hypothetical protein
MANAAHFRIRTRATLVGQPIGERPNSYQEARDMILPNSRWIARYSVRFYRFVDGDENLIRPDREITETWPDFEAGRDPAMDWVLRTITDPQTVGRKQSHVLDFSSSQFVPSLQTSFTKTVALINLTDDQYVKVKNPR